MTELDQQRIAEWIGDAFAILCVRIGGLSDAERNLRLGFEALLRQLGTSPLRMIAQTAPPVHTRATASSTDLRHILKALDSCLGVFQRYDAVLTSGQRRVQTLVRTTRRFADEELQSRRRPPRTRGGACRRRSLSAAAPVWRDLPPVSSADGRRPSRSRTRAPVQTAAGTSPRAG